MLRNIISSQHRKTKRNYIERMINDKVKCMKIAKKYNFHYWDGNRKYGYGGYKYIEGYWTNIAKKIISIYKLNNTSSLLDVGCGKAFLLYEIKKILPKIRIVGFDSSKYAIKNSKKEIKKNLFIHKAQNKFKFKDYEFDLAISINCIHNLEIFDLEKCIKEITRVSKKSYIATESYRNEKELFNLQCWALTCESFYSKSEWIWLLKKFGYNRDYEFIYF
mgnify:CR=1 FL=1|tara:strand:- start:161 stop:817 length:657 start_codon:yes stop_codon:yes gene_type:complete